MCSRKLCVACWSRSTGATGNKGRTHPVRRHIGQGTGWRQPLSGPIQTAMELPLSPNSAPDGRLPELPGWVQRLSGGSAEDAALASGVALGVLDVTLAHFALPQELWRRRLALLAAQNCVAMNRRTESESELRDILCMLRPDDQPGPAGEIALIWQRAIATPVTQARGPQGLPGDAERLRDIWMAKRAGNPVAQAAQVIEDVLSDDPRADLAALILADAAIARAARWRYLVPLLGIGLRRRDLNLRAAPTGLACHRALPLTIALALSRAADLTRRATYLQALVPKLRAKQAALAVDRFLSRDALSPAALTDLMSDRAARRLCARLVALGAVRELTGRDSFRIYGL